MGLIAIIANFISKKSELHAVTLALVELQGEHSGLNQAAIIQNVLNDYRICNKLGYMVMDNAGTNNTLIAAIADSLQDEGVLYNAGERRLRCMGYIINLAAEAFLFGQTVDDYEYPENVVESSTNTRLNQWQKLGSLGKLHNIIVWIMGNTQRIQAFKLRSGGLMAH